MEETIKSKLLEIQEKYNVQILYAVESGSRAWGFSSSNSDYDVRFIYVHRPSWYFTVSSGRDVIEVMDRDLNLDFAGWELRKALGLLKKGNPPFLEWLRSPQTYWEHPTATPELKKLSEGYYEPITAIHHYLHMAEGNYKAYIKGKQDVLVKKYLYIIRPLLACKWIEETGSFPPMEIDKTLTMLYNDSEEMVKFNILKLLDKKRNGEELGTGKPIFSLNSWIEHNLEYYAKYVKSLKKREKDSKELDQFLHKWAYEAWKS